MVSAVVPPVYVMVSAPVRPSAQPRIPSVFMDIREPTVVVDSTFAESAPSVDFSAVRRAAMGLTCVAPLPEALSPLPEESEELQEATPDSTVTAAIERLTRRTVVLFIGP